MVSRESLGAGTGRGSSAGRGGVFGEAARCAERSAVVILSGGRLRPESKDLNRTLAASVPASLRSLDEARDDEVQPLAKREPVVSPCIRRHVEEDRRPRSAEPRVGAGRLRAAKKPAALSGPHIAKPPALPEVAQR